MANLAWGPMKGMTRALLRCQKMPLLFLKFPSNFHEYLHTQNKKNTSDNVDLLAHLDGKNHNVKPSMHTTKTNLVVCIYMLVCKVYL